MKYHSPCQIVYQQLEEQYGNTDNARAGVTLRKYRNRMAWRRNKVRELLARGYHQDEIASTLHISQPTISRDIHYIQTEMRKSADNYDKHRFVLLTMNKTVEYVKQMLDMVVHLEMHIS